MTKSDAGDRAGNGPLIIGLIFVVVVVGIWAFGFSYARWRSESVPAGVHSIEKSIERSGQYGDSFGAVNALFSGLAFVGVIVAILLQRQELQLQREELTKSVEAQQGTEKALRAQGILLRNANHAAILSSIAAQLQRDDVREARRLILINADKADRKPTGGRSSQAILTAFNWQPSNDGEDQYVELIAGTFDFAAIMATRSRWVTNALIQTWGRTMCRLWYLMQSHLNELRESQRDPIRWEHYEAFVAKAEAWWKQKGIQF